MLVKIKGKIEFSPEDVTKKHKNQSSWKRVAMIRTDCELDRYYSWFIKKRFNLELNRTLRGAHVTFISDKLEKGVFDQASAIFNEKDIDFYIGGQTLIAAGISLGGNALMRWAAEHGASALQNADAIASICSPLDLMQSGQAIGRGLNRQIYTRMFLRSMKPKALSKWAQHPGLFDRQKLLQARDLYEFDNVFTAPLHGFKNTDDYWTRASAKPRMRDIRLPALALNARNDPFVPTTSLPQVNEVSSSVTLWQPQHGGHVGFAQGAWPGHVRGLPDAVGAWLLQAAGCSLSTETMRHG